MTRNDSPEARLATAFRELLERTWREARKRGENKPYPDLPDFADIRDELRPFILREVLTARIEESERFGTYPRVLDLLRQRDEVNREIASRNPSQ